MRYFLVKEDKRYKNRPIIRDFNSVISPKDLKEGNYSKIPKRIIMKVKPDASIEFVDIIMVPFVIVSKVIYQLLEKFEPNLQFKEIVLLDKKNGKVGEYFMPLLSKCDCLTKKSTYNFDKSEITKAVIDRNLIGDKCIFKFSVGSSNLVVIRLDVAELILRRNASGFLLEEAVYDEEE